MKDRSSIILILQVLPILVLVVALIDPSSAIPLIVVLFVLFPFVLWKFLQQATKDFERELYTKNQEKTEFKNWYEMPIFEMEEMESDREFLAVRPHLEILQLAYPFTEDDLNRAYRRRARETHPDVPGGNEREFIRVRQAYEALKEFWRSNSEGMTG
ncbi:hypothetical protein AY599_27505 [Leptolyngbya valderiana BDU 20041]|uniref:J domain-containing protein n=1 Tax=Baaleninema simplex TaxID=2862350 RepID=UPI00034CC8DB|nr:J domain-containing protein [Baaleninema simplex]OAB61882.1 hypothetical protein AY599_27505 [Leptolyngbya valderiana BDU 20041]